jgi:hypothetical protein
VGPVMTKEHTSITHPQNVRWKLLDFFVGWKQEPTCTQLFGVWSHNGIFGWDQLQLGLIEARLP